MTRLRARWTKLGKVRFTSHRDAARIWERALRRTELPVARTEGFSPRPKLHFGLALSTGHESLAEYLDIDLRAGVEATADEVDLPTLPERLTDALPEGMACVAVAPVAAGTPSLQEAVGCCTWQISTTASPAALQAGVDQALAATTLPLTRERKGRSTTDDLRPAILRLEVLGPDGDDTVLVADLATGTRAVRPGELLQVLDPTLVERRVLRLHQWLTPAGAPWEEPLPVDATRAPHAWVRAS